MIEQAFRTQAALTGGVTSLIGSAPMRLSPNVVPRAYALPAAAYSLISDVREHAMGADAGVRHARIQVTCLADTYLAARELADAFALAFSRWSGTSAGVVVQDVFVENIRGDLDETAGQEKGEGVAMATLDLLFHYEG